MFNSIIAATAMLLTTTVGSFAQHPGSVPDKSLSELTIMKIEHMICEREVDENKYQELFIQAVLEYDMSPSQVNEAIAIAIISISSRFGGKKELCNSIEALRKGAPA